MRNEVRNVIKLEKTGLVLQSMDIMPISYTKSQKMHLENMCPAEWSSSNTCM
jgi:hypothetical protein